MKPFLPLLLATLLATTSLAADPAPQPSQPSLDLNGDPLPPGALARFGSSRFRQNYPPNTAAITPDNSTVITADAGDLCFFQLPNGQLLRRIHLSDQPIHSLSLSPDGKTLAALYDIYQPNSLNAIALIDLATGKTTATLQDSPRLSKIAADNPKVFRIDSSVHITPFIDLVPPTLSWSPDGKSLLTTGSLARLWNVQTRRVDRTFEHHTLVIAAALSPDGKLLATGGDDMKILLWDPATGKPLGTIEAPLPTTHPDWPKDMPKDDPTSPWATRSLAFSPDGTLLAWGDVREGKIRLIDVPTRKILRTLQFQNNWNVAALSFLDSGKTVIARAAGATNEIQLWNTATGKSPTDRAIDFGKGLSNRYEYVFTLSPDQSLLAYTGPLSTSISLRNLKTNEPLPALALPGHSSFVASVAWDATRAFTQDEHTIRSWDAATGKLLAETQPTSLYGNLWDVLHLSPDGRSLLTTDVGGNIDIFNPATLQRTATLKVGPVWRGYTLSPDGALLASAGNKKARITRLADSKELASFDAPFDYRIETPVFLPDGSGILFTDGHAVTTARITGASSVTRNFGNNSYLYGLTLLTQTATPIVGEYHGGNENKQFLQFLSLDTAAPLATLELDSEIAYDGLIPSPDQRFLAIRYRLAPKVDLYELATLQKVLTIPAGKISSLAFSPSGTQILTGRYDSTALSWTLNPLPYTTADTPPAASSPSTAPITDTTDITDQDITTLWTTLTSDDNAPAAYRASWQLKAHPDQALALIRSNLKVEDHAAEIATLISQLDSDQYKVRTAAIARLRQLASIAQPQLRKLAAETTGEPRTLAQSLIANGLSPILTPEARTARRAIYTLELLATPGSLTLLRQLASGPPSSFATLEATHALSRLPAPQPAK